MVWLCLSRPRFYSHWSPGSYTSLRSLASTDSCFSAQISSCQDFFSSLTMTNRYSKLCWVVSSLPLFANHRELRLSSRRSASRALSTLANCHPVSWFLPVYSSPAAALSWKRLMMATVTCESAARLEQKPMTSAFSLLASPWRSVASPSAISVEILTATVGHYCYHSSSPSLSTSASFGIGSSLSCNPTWVAALGGSGQQSLAERPLLRSPSLL